MMMWFSWFINDNVVLLYFWAIVVFIILNLVYLSNCFKEMWFFLFLNLCGKRASASLFTLSHVVLWPYSSYSVLCTFFQLLMWFFFWCRKEGHIVVVIQVSGAY